MFFGDIFFIGEKEYVWIFSDGTTVSAAFIFDKEKTDIVKVAQRRDDKRGTSHTNPMYCYVELSTAEYENCTANMLATQAPIDINLVFRKINKRLDDVDLSNIKKEILQYRELFKPALIEYLESTPL